MILMDRSEDEILAAIESGALPFAWHIGSSHADRREIRVWRESLLEFLEGRKPEPIGEGEVMRRILPQQDTIKSTQLQRVLSCSSTLVHQLFEEGCFGALAVERPKESGPHSALTFQRGRVDAWLRGRRVL
jgi:hypothetical protein